MTDYGTSNISGSTGGRSGPPLHRDLVSVTNMEDCFKYVRVQAGCQAGKPCRIPLRQTYPSERGGHSGPPLRRDFVSVSNEIDDFQAINHPPLHNLQVIPLWQLWERRVRFGLVPERCARDVILER